MTEHKNSKLLYWIIVLCGCGITAASTGISNCYGIMFKPMAADFSCGIGQVSLAVTLKNLTTGFLVLSLPYWYSRIDTRRIIAIGGVTAALSLFAQSLFIDLRLFYFFSILQGIGNCFISTATLNFIINNWFYKKTGLALGIGMAASGIFGAVLSPVFTRFCMTNGWQASLQLMAVIVFFLCLPGILFACSFPEYKGLPPYGGTTPIKKDRPARIWPGISYRLVAAVLFSFLTSCMTGFGNHLPSYAVSRGFTPEFGAVLLSASMIGNLSSKLLIGVISDKLKPALICIFGLVAVGSVFIVLSCSTESQLIITVSAFLFGSVYGLCTVGGTQYLRESVGRMYFPSAYSLYQLAMSVGSAVAVALIGFSYDRTMSYSQVLITGAVMCLLAIIMLTAGIVRKKVSPESSDPA